jgi:hypothetical protein
MKVQLGLRPSRKWVFNNTYVSIYRHQHVEGLLHCRPPNKQTQLPFAWNSCRAHEGYEHSPPSILQGMQYLQRGMHAQIKEEQKGRTLEREKR